MSFRASRVRRHRGEQVRLRPDHRGFSQAVPAQPDRRRQVHQHAELIPVTSWGPVRFGPVPVLSERQLIDHCRARRCRSDGGHSAQSSGHDPFTLLMNVPFAPSDSVLSRYVASQ